MLIVNYSFWAVTSKYCNGLGQNWASVVKFRRWSSKNLVNTLNHSDEMEARHYNGAFCYRGFQNNILEWFEVEEKKSHSCLPGFWCCQCRWSSGCFVDVWRRPLTAPWVWQALSQNLNSWPELLCHASCVRFSCERTWLVWWETANTCFGCFRCWILNCQRYVQLYIVSFIYLSQIPISHLISNTPYPALGY